MQQTIPVKIKALNPVPMKTIHPLCFNIRIPRKKNLHGHLQHKPIRCQNKVQKKLRNREYIFGYSKEKNQSFCFVSLKTKEYSIMHSQSIVKNTLNLVN
ncbi:hypothetical protein RchiOBHm_Chr5g0023341 [Rosa chinensis]|uniref:Uncharacterized protein n=1 Tax=Rosa chinensis TaxID=74649 RepID=A0A2P6Q824_ROSCH|nr:hypothetical protein RchiOBHm_Chr5g0023341 [Rosa chinensis]